MNRLSPAVNYRAILAMPGVRRSFIAVNIARLSYSSLPLALLVTVHNVTGSYAAAGIALGASAGATVVMPVKSRLIDRIGARRVLPWLAAAFAFVMVAIAACSVTTVHAAWVYIALCAAAGLATPPVGPSMRSLLFVLMPNTSVRQRAYALDATAEETVQIAGPLLVAATLATGLTGSVLVVVGVLNLAGAVLLAFSTRPAVSSSVAHIAKDKWGPLRSRGFRLLLLVSFGITVGSAPLEVAIVARCGEFGAPSAAAYVLAALSVGSAVGGALWGLASRPVIKLTGLTALMAAGCALASLANSAVVLGIVVAIGALANAPTRILEYLWADRVAAAGNRTEATTWVSTANNVGASIGVSAGGLLVQLLGATGAMDVGAVLLGAVAALLLVRRRRAG